MKILMAIGIILLAGCSTSSLRTPEAAYHESGAPAWIVECRRQSLCELAAKTACLDGYLVDSKSTSFERDNGGWYWTRYGGSRDRALITMKVVCF